MKASADVMVLEAFALTETTAYVLCLQIFFKCTLAQIACTDIHPLHQDVRKRLLYDKHQPQDSEITRANNFDALCN